MLAHTPRLISFGVCPFAQRTQILLALKGLAHHVETIDLENKPDWFLDRVPTGLVPALFVGDETLFESAVINEFLDEITPGPVLPTDPLARAKARAWIKQSDALIFDQYHMLAAKTEDSYRSARADFEAALARFAPVAVPETGAETGAETAADGVSMLDLSIAPVFIRMHALGQLGIAPFDVAQPILDWGARILGHPKVAGCVPPHFTTDLIAFFGGRNSFVFAPAFAQRASGTVFA